MGDKTLASNLRASNEMPELGNIIITASALRMNPNAKYISMFEDGAETRAKAIADMQVGENIENKEEAEQGFEPGD